MVSRVPAATPFDSGVPAVEDVSPGVIPVFGDCVQLQDKAGPYALSRRGAEHRACRSGGRYRENRPAFPQFVVGWVRYFSNQAMMFSTFEINWLGRRPMKCGAPGSRTTAVSIPWNLRAWKSW